jgi:hypothetical protein
VVAQAGPGGPGDLRHASGVAVVLAGGRPQDVRTRRAGDQAIAPELGDGPLRREAGQDRVKALRLEGGGFHAPLIGPWD